MSRTLEEIAANLEKMAKILKLYAHARSARKIGNEAEASAFEEKADKMSAAMRKASE